MDRRQFCRSTLAASIAAGFPYLAGCGERASAPVASNADTSMAAVSLDGEAIELERAAVRELGEALQGPVMMSGHPQYDTARRIWNGMHDKHPALIAQVASETDVSRAVQFARDHNLLVAVRGGGHSWPGKSVCDGGLMIDLSALNKVTVDDYDKRAYVGGGALLNNLDTATLERGLVTTGGVVSHTGVGGYTLGGGFGRLNRKYGLTIDNLLGAEIVTPDGEVRFVSEYEEPSLFWAIRGGGGNFGVVTRFEYQLHPFDRNVLSGMIAWPIEEARDVLDFYGGWYDTLSDDLYVGPAMMTMPDGTSVVAMEVVYAGDPAKGEKELEPLRKIGKPIEDGIKVQDYMVMQTQEDSALAHGIRSYAKSGMIREFSGELVDTLIDSFVPDPRLAFFTHTAGGAIKRVDVDATAFPHRNAESMILVLAFWTDPEQDREWMAAGREWFAKLEPFTGGYYDNIEYEGDEASGNYGPVYDRLARVKAKFDPGNLFRLNANVEPASSA
jgi:FAD/FMN-containing dehydrogenase